MVIDHSLFEHLRLRSRSDLPPASAEVIDVVILDMNFGFPNLGHDSLVHAVHESAREIDLGGSSVRVLSVDVRRGGWLPEPDPDRFRLYLGTGGPGHLDPKQNDGVGVWSEGVRDEADWEPALFELFDSILANELISLFAYCHSFGVMCRWSGIATPVIRSEKKGKSSGIVGYQLSDEAYQHPWFSRFASELVAAPRFRVLDSRMFDLIPTAQLADKALPLAWEDDPRGGEPALTMVEFARDRTGQMPRVLAANHHPEVVDLAHLEEVLDEKLEIGEVDEVWHRERGEALRSFWDEPDTDVRVRRTSRYTLLDPLRFAIESIVSSRTGIGS